MTDGHTDGQTPAHMNVRMTEDKTICPHPFRGGAIKMKGDSFGNEKMIRLKLIELH